uniref:Uncharacterized protein n=1 Tax=Rhinopithecus roxellana TaxID=61622 RepID=A0A2K6RLP6_RHIRO
MQTRSCGRSPAPPHPVDERLGVHPLGPGPILHLGGSSPPKIKFLQHPFSFQSPQPPEPRKSTRCAIHPEEPHNRRCPSSEDSRTLHWLPTDETHPSTHYLGGGGGGGRPPHACTADEWGPALPILPSSGQGTLVGVVPSHCWIRTF